jgi:hypothetical protein
MTMQYLTCCVDCPPAEVPDLCEMIERERQVTYRTLMRRVGRDVLASVPQFDGYDWRKRPRDLTMSRDWHVSYHRSVFRGRRCYFVRWSAIEFIFA